MINWLAYLLVFLILAGCASGSEKSLGRILIDSTISSLSRQSQTNLNNSIKNSRFSFMHVKLGRNIEATLELAYIKDGIYEWRGNDGVRIFTKDGIIIKTIGLMPDISYEYNISNLFEERESEPFYSKIRFYSPDLEFIRGINQLYPMDNEIILYKEKEVQTKKFKITREIAELNWKKSNYFYFLNNRVIYSEQYLNPFLPKVLITFYY